MEEKFDQIEMDVGGVEEIAQNQEQEISSVEPPIKPVRQEILETVRIDEANYNVENELDYDVELITPDVDVFEMASKEATGGTDMAQWTHEVIKRNSEDDRAEYDSETTDKSGRSDHDFMKAFGISDKAGNITIDVDDAIHSSAEIETLQGDIHSDYYEYTDRQQRKEIIGMYKYAMRSMRTKMIISSIFVLFLLLIESISLFSKNPTGIFNIVEHPYLHFFLDFIAFGACVCLAYQQIYHGIKSIISKEAIL